MNLGRGLVIRTDRSLPRRIQYDYVWFQTLGDGTRVVRSEDPVSFKIPQTSLSKHQISNRTFGPPEAPR